MKADVVLAGVGGQGVLTAAALLAEAGRREGLTVKQGEVHGMAQRGGAVQATLRLADGPVFGDLVPRGGADVVLGMEPLEAVRCLPFLATEGCLLTSSDPHDDLPGYPDVETLLAEVRRLPWGIIVEAKALARSVKAPRAANVVMVGAAVPLLPLEAATVEGCIRDLFAPRGAKMVDRNLAALAAGLGVGVRP